MTVIISPESPPSALVSGHNAARCRWATPTLLLPTPFWLDAENRPWTCVRDAAPRTLITTDACATCPRWEPRQSVAPLMLDWFGAFRPPHETE